MRGLADFLLTQQDAEYIDSQHHAAKCPPPSQALSLDLTAVSKFQVEKGKQSIVEGGGGPNLLASAATPPPHPTQAHVCSAPFQSQANYCATFHYSRSQLRRSCYTRKLSTSHPVRSPVPQNVHKLVHVVAAFI